VDVGQQTDPISKAIAATRFGTMNQRKVRLGLNQLRATTLTAPRPRRWAEPASALNPLMIWLR
jgi:hypothetical protein